jgi:predicted nuclease with TOPRIM domain
VPDETAEQPAKVTTQHKEANKAIETLREIATTLKHVGDENVELQEDYERANDHAGELEQQMSEMRADHETLESWRETIEDYQRGILDKGELFDRTIGGLL